MLTIVVRGRKDASAVEAAVERFYPEWGVKVETLHGARTADKAEEELARIFGKHGFYIIMLGRDDASLARELTSMIPPTAVVHMVPRARVRNARLEMIANEIARAKSRFRVSIGWYEEFRAYRYSPKLWPKGLREPPEPSYEGYLGLGEFARILGKVTGVHVCENPLIIRTISEEHLVYSGADIVAKIYIKDRGFLPRVEAVSKECVDVKLDNIIKANLDVIRAFEDASIKFLRSLGEYDTIIVPWSGGKDSTATLLLAVKAFGAKRVIAIFGDTGTEFPQTLEYVEKISSKLGVRVERAYAGIDKKLLEGMPLPTHDNRWCTALKIEAIEKKAAEVASGKTLIVVGDRDAESPSRSTRPTLRKASYIEDVTVVAPIRLWGGFHVQLYLLANGIELNPLYYRGFYRIGCYMCPSLRSWEIASIISTEIHLRLLKSSIYRRFIVERLFKKPR